MLVTYNDGGRAAAGYTGKARDCVVRSIAIAMRRPYGEVYEAMAAVNARTPLTRRRVKTTGQHTAAHGIYTTSKVFKDWMTAQGWVFVPTMSIGSGCRVHLRAGELPMGRIIARVSKHFVAVIDGVIHDTGDCSRGGTRCVYGYWRKA